MRAILEMCVVIFGDEISEEGSEEIHLINVERISDE